MLSSLTIEAIDGFLSHPSSDPAINPLVLVALVLQEVLEQVQHLGHLQRNTGRTFVRRFLKFCLGFTSQVACLVSYLREDEHSVSSILQLPHHLLQ